MFGAPLGGPGWSAVEDLFRGRADLFGHDADDGIACGLGKGGLIDVVEGHAAAFQTGTKASSSASNSSRS